MKGALLICLLAFTGLVAAGWTTISTDSASSVYYSHPASLSSLVCLLNNDTSGGKILSDLSSTTIAVLPQTSLFNSNAWCYLNENEPYLDFNGHTQCLFVAEESSQIEGGMGDMPDDPLPTEPEIIEDGPNPLQTFNDGNISWTSHKYAICDLDGSCYIDFNVSVVNNETAVRFVPGSDFELSSDLQISNIQVISAIETPIYTPMFGLVPYNYTCNGSVGTCIDNLSSLCCYYNGTIVFDNSYESYNESTQTFTYLDDGYIGVSEEYRTDYKLSFDADYIGPGDISQYRAVFNTRPGTSGEFDIHLTANSAPIIVLPTDKDGRLLPLYHYDAYFINPLESNYDPWFNTTWKYRQAIKIKSTTANYTNMQVRLYLNTTRVGAHFNWTAACSDLRFTQSDGSTLIDHWVESCDSGGKTAYVWVEAPTLTLNTNVTYYMYYNKSGTTTSTSSGYNTFLFFEPWNNAALNTTNWNYVSQAPTYSINAATNLINFTDSNAPAGGVYSKAITFPATWRMEALTGTGGFYQYGKADTATNAEIQPVGIVHGNWSTSDWCVGCSAFSDDSGSNSNICWYAAVGGVNDWGTSCTAAGSLTDYWLITKYVNGSINVDQSGVTRHSEANSETPTSVLMGTYRSPANSYGTTKVGAFKIRQYASTAPTPYYGSEEGSAVCGNSIVETGEQCDDGNTNNGDCCSSTCQYESAATVCRAAAGVCDTQELCDGAGTCPADAFNASTTVCRANAGICDKPENCTGSTASCPADAYNSTSICRASAGICDTAETCPGTGINCPADVFNATTDICNPGDGTCWLDANCTGTGASCPARLANSTVTTITWNWADINSSINVTYTSPEIQLNRDATCVFHLAATPYINLTMADTINWTLTGMAEANYTPTYADCTDVCGDYVNSTEAWLDVDLTAPTMSYNWTDRNSIINVNGTYLCINASELVRCDLHFNGTTVANATYSTNVCWNRTAISEGNHTNIYASCNDSAGNVGLPTATSWLYIDTVAPNFTWTWADINSSTNSYATTITGTSNESVNCSLYHNNVIDATTTYGAAITFSVTSLGHVNNTYFIICDDIAGNPVNSTKAWWYTLATSGGAGGSGGGGIMGETTLSLDPIEALPMNNIQEDGYALFRVNVINNGSIFMGYTTFYSNNKYLMPCYTVNKSDINREYARGAYALDIRCNIKSLNGTAYGSKVCVRNVGTNEQACGNLTADTNIRTPTGASSFFQDNPAIVLIIMLSIFTTLFMRRRGQPKGNRIQ